MIILGIDCALARSGLAILDADILGNPDRWTVPFTGVLTTKQSQPREQRLHEIRIQIGNLIRDLKPDEVVVEEPGRWTRGKKDSTQTTVIALAQARAVIQECCYEHDIPVFLITTNDAKLSVAHATATKQIVQRNLKALNLYDGDDDDIADAVMIAYARARRLRAKLQEEEHERRYQARIRRE